MMIDYKGMVIMPRGNSVDVWNPSTGKWFVVKSIQSAKWHIAVLTRIRSQ